MIPVERYGNLVLQSKVIIATQPSTPVEAVGRFLPNTLCVLIMDDAFVHSW